MTQNQIAYHNAQELQRHNLETEKETQRHQKQQEALQKRSNELSEQANSITQAHYERMDAINAQHYQNQDEYNRMVLEETKRSDLENEAIRQMQNAINAAANSELARHQRATELIQRNLANSTISKEQSEMSYITANATYTRGRADQLRYQNGLYSAQTSSTWEDLWHTRADTQLKKAQERNTQVNIGTQKSQQFLNVTSGVNNIVDTANGLFRLLTAGAGVRAR